MLLVMFEKSPDNRSSHGGMCADGCPVIPRSFNTQHKPKMTRLQLPILALATLLAATLSAEGASTGLRWIDSNTNLTVYGDIRLRYEADWDSQTTTGAPRDDRNRGRIRARLGFGYRLSDEWSAGARVRTGNSRSQQSPHLTFSADRGGRDDLDFVVDRYFLQYKRGTFTGWGGRNGSPFWQQNELFWDEDVTPTGLAGTYDWKLAKGTLSAIAGAFYLPDGGYDLNGRMLAGQLKYTAPINKSQITTAAGLFYMDGASGARNLRNQNGARDYLIGVAGAQWSIPIRKLPFALGADLFHNFKDYAAGDPLSMIGAIDHHNETLGYVLSAQLGQLKDKNNWLLGYYYSHIETFSVNASYAQDDWHRFGSATQTDASDFEGHEFRAGYALTKSINILARLYLVEAITTVQNGSRFRVDLNWKF